MGGGAGELIYFKYAKGGLNRDGGLIKLAKLTDERYFVLILVKKKCSIKQFVVYCLVVKKMGVWGGA